ncbi:hypothetical protein [Clostridium novyi]|uniref:hypothetical protein n=1 Tax=Clostridium novyi TaxID=1542 RepID=UPI001FA6D25D|nr:hypothetical protein [Clostridium novyi]
MKMVCICIFFDSDEIKELFEKFAEVYVDEIIETHNSMKYCDANFVISLVK